MNKYIPLIALSVAAFYMYRASDLIKVAAEVQAPDTNVGNGNKPTEQKVARAPSATKSNEPAYKSVVRCLGDLDDILDGITSPASFAAAKPKLLNRVRQQAALAAEHPNQGMTQLSKAAAKEMSKAANRHTESMIRANNIAPGVAAFFEKEVAAVLDQK